MKINENLGKKITKNMCPTIVCMFVCFMNHFTFCFGLRYLHLDIFQFLHRYPSLHVQVCLYVFFSKIGPQFWETVGVVLPVSGDHLAFASHALAPHYSSIACFYACQSISPMKKANPILSHKH